MFKADDYRLKIQAMGEILKEAEYALDIEHLRPRLAELEKEQENPEVWQDLEKSTKRAQRRFPTLRTSWI